MEQLVFENPSHDEFDPLVILLSLIVIIALGSLPLLLLPNGLIWSVLIWSGSIFIIAIGFWSYDAKKIKFIHIENSGIGLQFKNGKYRKIDWEQIKTIRPIEGDTGGIWLLITMFPFAYRKEDMEEEKEGLLLVGDGSRYRISWQIAEAIHRVIMIPREGGRYEPRLCGSLQRLRLPVKSFVESSDGSDGRWRRRTMEYPYRVTSAPISVFLVRPPVLPSNRSILSRATKEKIRRGLFMARSALKSFVF